MITLSRPRFASASDLLLLKKLTAKVPFLKKLIARVPLLQALSTDEETDPFKAFVINAIALIVWGLFSAAFCAVVNFWWPHIIPYEFFDLWKSKGTLADWLAAGTPMFIWAVVLNSAILFSTRNKPEQNKHAEAGLTVGLIRSVWAGISEEILFRWLIYMGAFATAACCNFLFFQGWWFHFGTTEWFQIHIAGPWADFTSNGYMREYLNNPTNWMMGAAIIASNTQFRDGHKYQGIVGVVNSWYGGLFLFYIMFKFGLPAAIVVHAGYDILCYVVAYFDSIVERAQGNA